MEYEMDWWLSQPIEEPWTPWQSDREMFEAIIEGLLEPPCDYLAPPI